MAEFLVGIKDKKSDLKEYRLLATPGGKGWGYDTELDGGLLSESPNAPFSDLDLDGLARSVAEYFGHNCLNPIEEVLTVQINNSEPKVLGKNYKALTRKEFTDFKGCLEHYLKNIDLSEEEKDIIAERREQLTDLRNKMK